MKKYLGEIWAENNPKNKKWWQFWKFTESKIAHKFSQTIIEADSYFEAHNKMKSYADEYVDKAKQLPNSDFMNNLTFKSFVTEEI